MIVVSEMDFLNTYNNQKQAKVSLSRCKNFLPLSANPELAEIVADLITDGHLASRKIGNRTKYNYIGFFSDETEELESFRKKFKKIFGVDGEICNWGKRYNGSSKGVIVCNSPIERTLMLSGVPIGRKTIAKFGVPKWILTSTSEIQRSFLRRLFDCDGTICKHSKKAKGWDIRFYVYKSEKLEENVIKYLSDIKGMLHTTFNIHSNIITYNTYTNKKSNEKIKGYELRIQKKDSVRKFIEKIGFSNKNKKVKSQKALEWAYPG